MTELPQKTSSQGDRMRTRAYLRDFIPGIVGYTIAIIGVLALVDNDSSSAWNYVWKLVPMLPALWALRAIVRHLRRADEFQRLVQFEGMATGFGTAMVASLTIALLGIGSLGAEGSGWIIYGAGMAAWGITAAIKGK